MGASGCTLLYVIDTQRNTAASLDAYLSIMALKCVRGSTPAGRSVHTLVCVGITGIITHGIII